MIDLNSTMEEIIEEINSKGSGGGGGTTELTTQYVRITDLEDGVYKWTYDGVKYLYYYGETNTSIRNFSAGSVLLFVYGTRTIDDTTKKYYKHWIAFGETNTNTTSTSVSTYYIVYGYTYATWGTQKSKYLDYIPTSTAMTLSGAQTVSGNKTFSGTNTHSGTETFTGAVDILDATFSDSAQFLGDVDFTNANVIGLSTNSSGASGGGAGMSYKEIKLSNMYSSTSSTTNTKITGTVYIKAWLPDTEEITDFASVVALMSKLAGGTAINSCAYPAWGYAQISSVNKRIFYVCPTSAGGLNLLGLYPNTNESSNNSMNYLSLGTALKATVTVTTLIEGGISSGGSSGGGKTKITVAELNALLADYQNNAGTTIQFVYTGTNTDNAWINCLNLVGTVTIHNCSTLFKKVTNITDGGASALYYYDYELYYDFESGDAYIQYASYDWSNSGGISQDENVMEDITDDNFDIYVIG